MSGWLERPLGNNVACGATAIAPTIAAVLALADFTALSARFVTLGGRRGWARATAKSNLIVLLAIANDSVLLFLQVLISLCPFLVAHTIK